MEQLPQNLKTLLQEIGESSVLLRLTMLIAKKAKKTWKVYRTYTEDGCDIVVRRVHGKPRPGYRKELRIEVKARQNIITTRKGQQMQFQASKAEYESAHFLVGFWFEKGHYFIVPIQDLKPSSKAKTHYRFVANVLRTGEYNIESKKYLDRWDRILNLIK